tara:strand:- start:2045 stop:4054 length:2010 start_codon:yes stop_codon:yes gene_type:complete
MAKKKTTARPHVSRVFSNLKSPLPNGDAWSVDLAPKTLLVGSNTSHKSSVIQSVELALAGSADDIVGRSAVADAALLLTLAPNDELGMSATTSDGDMYSYNVKYEAGGRIKKPRHTGPGASALTHRTVREALVGSAATARKAFLSWACDDASLEDVLAHIPSELHAKYRDIAEYMGHDKDPVGTLLTVAQYANKKQRDASKEAKGAESLLESMGEVAEERPTDEQMTRARTAAVNIRETLRRAIEASGSGMSRDEHEQAIAQASTALAAWENQRDMALEAAKKARASIPELSPTVQPGVDILNIALDNNVESCPVCSSAVGTGHITLCRDFYAGQLKDWESLTDAARRSIEATGAEAQGAESNVVEWKLKLEHLAGVNVVDRSGNPADVLDVQARLEIANKAVSSMEAQVERWDSITRARDRVSAMREEAGEYKLLKEATENAVGCLLDKRVGAFVQRVAAYLPSDWDFGIELKDGKREVFRMGLRRGHKLHCALSGAEWASVTTAIAMVVSERLPMSDVAVLIPEDRAWDPKTLSAVMRAYGSFNGQVIMASTIKPRGKVPGGWTVIDMDKESASWLGGGDSEEDEPAQVRSALEIPENGVNVTTRSAILLEQRGFSPEEVALMSKQTQDVVIADDLKPGSIVIREDGTYALARGGQVLQLPPSPLVR